MDLPLWELAKLVKGASIQFASKESTDHNESRKVLDKHKKTVDQEKVSNKVVPMCSKSDDNATTAIHIPGVDIERLYSKIKEIIASANCDELTVKGVRKMLETWLGMRLSKYHHEIKALIVEAM